MFERAALRLSFRDVADDGDVEVPAHRNLAQRDLDGELAAVRREYRALENRARERRELAAFAAESGDEVAERRIEQRRAPAAEYARRRGVRAADDSVLIDAQDAVGRRLDDATEQRVAAFHAQRVGDRAPGLAVKRSRRRGDEQDQQHDGERHDLEHDALRGVE